MSETVSGNTASSDPANRPTVGNAGSSATAPGHELDASPWMRVESTLMATAGLMRETYDRALEPLGLNLTDASLLAYVVESGPLKQTSIADHLSIGRAAAGNVIDRLQKRELVERHADDNDRRVWLVAPTATGEELAAEISAVDVRLRQELRLGIDRHERQMLATLLVRLQRNLLSASARDTPSPDSSPNNPTTDRKHT